MGVDLYVIPIFRGCSGSQTWCERWTWCHGVAQPYRRLAVSVDETGGCGAVRPKAIRPTNLLF